MVIIQDTQNHNEILLMHVPQRSDTRMSARPRPQEIEYIQDYCHRLNHEQWEAKQWWRSVDTLQHAPTFCSYRAGRQWRARCPGSDRTRQVQIHAADPRCFVRPPDTTERYSMHSQWWLRLSSRQERKDLNRGHRLFPTVTSTSWYTHYTGRIGLWK